MQRILIASDLSDRAAAAVARGIRLAVARRAGLVLLHVLEEEPGREVLGRIWPEIADRSQEADSAARALNDVVSAAGVTAAVAVAEGKAFVEIVQEARRTAADLIVLGAHGRHFLRDLWLGTTAEQVVRKCERPVLVVREPVDEDYRRVLVAVDFSPGSEAAVRMALKVAPDAELVLLHAYDSWFEPYMRRAGAEDHQLLEAHRAVAAEYTTELARFVRRLGLDGSVRQVVRGGYPGPTIAAEALRRGADLVAVGARGHGSLHYALLGSTAEHVLREAHCDVLAVRAGPPSLELP